MNKNYNGTLQEYLLAFQEFAIHKGDNFVMNAPSLVLIS